MRRVAFALALASLAGCSEAPIKPPAEQAAPGGSFQLTDTAGRTVTDRTLRGKPYAIFFGFARCPDICPTTMARMALLHERLGADATRLSIVFVSVDPEHDKPADIASFLSMFEVPAIGLTGTPAQLAAAEKAFRIYVERVPLPNGDYTIDHSAKIMLFDREGRYAGAMDAAMPEDQALTQLRQLIRA